VLCVKFSLLSSWSLLGLLDWVLNNKIYFFPLCVLCVFCFSSVSSVVNLLVEGGMGFLNNISFFSVFSVCFV